MKLLYAEDEISMSEAIVDILEYHNYIVDAVYDGASALEYARSEHYDGIILDIMMPRKSGLEVLQALRREGCRTPILLLTAKNRRAALGSSNMQALPRHILREPCMYFWIPPQIIFRLFGSSAFP